MLKTPRLSHDDQQRFESTLKLEGQTRLFLSTHPPPIRTRMTPIRQLEAAVVSCHDGLKDVMFLLMGTDTVSSV